LIIFVHHTTAGKEKEKLEAKDDLPNINHTQATERAEKCCFLSMVTLILTFKLVRVRDETRLPAAEITHVEIDVRWAANTAAQKTPARFMNRDS